MKHWYLQDSHGNNIGNISLNDGYDTQLPAAIIGGDKFALGGGWREGSKDLAWFTVVPEPATEG